jgi:trehalose-phosphatase
MFVALNQDVRTIFFEELRQAAVRILLLDYDGTLAPFTPKRQQAFPYPGIPELVSKIMRTGTRVVLISGRPASELLFLSRIHPHPEIWGSHGRERLFPDGSYFLEPPAPEQQSGLDVVIGFLHAAGLDPYMEQKPGSVAVHWRGLSQEEQGRVEAAARELLAPAAEEYGLELLPFDAGLELRAPGKNKGSAVRDILAETGTGTVSAYLGDDQTDEDAFRAIKGRGLSVLVRPEPRSTAADVWIRPPEELSAFLRDWLSACGTER